MSAAAGPSRFALWISLLVLVGSSTAGAQSLFVVSQNTASVLEYDAQTGAFLSTFVSPVTEGFQLPGGIAIHPGSGVLYVASTGSGEIWRYTTATGALDPPAAAEGLVGPGSLGFDATGANLYFVAAADGLSVGTDSVMRLAIGTGVVSNLVTDGTAEFNSVTVNGSNLYVSDGVNNRVMRYTTAGGSATAIITGLSLPGGVLFRSSTDLLVADTGTDRVLEYTWSGSSWAFDRVVLPASAGVDGPYGLALGPDGRLTVSGRFSDEVVAVDLTTLAVSSLVSPGEAGLVNAKDVAWSGSTLLVASGGSNSVLYYDSAGAPTGTVARGISAPTDGAMTVTPAGDLIVASVSDNDLVELDGVGGGVLRKYFDACPTSLAAPYDVAVGPDANVYATCNGSDAVHRFTPTGTPLGFFVTGGSGGLSFPRGLVFGPGGNLFVASGFTREVLQYHGGTGAFVDVFVDANGNGGGPMDPYGLAFHQGSLYVVNSFYDDVKRFDATTGAFQSTFVSSGSGGLSGPTAAEFGPDGDLYVTSYADDAVRRYSGTSGGYLSTFVASGSGGLDGPIDLGFSAQSEPPEPVPALSPVALAALIAALAIAGARGARRSA